MIQYENAVPWNDLSRWTRRCGKTGMSPEVSHQM